jgi:hypothetical protein
MRRPAIAALTIVILVVLVALGAMTGAGASAGSAAGQEVEAAAKFSVTYGGDTAKFRFGQSSIVTSELGATPQVPVSLHAAPKNHPLDGEFVLAGRLKKGKQKTSQAVVLSLNISIGTRSAFYISDDGTCTVKVKALTDSRIAGSFTCNAEYGDEPLTAKGNFKAK